MTYVGVIRFWLPSYVQHELIPQVADLLNAELVVDRIIPKPLSGSVELRGVSLNDHDGQQLATSRSIEIKANLLSVYQKDTINLSSLQIQSAELWLKTDETHTLNWQPLIDRIRELASQADRTTSNNTIKVVLNRTSLQACKLHLAFADRPAFTVNLKQLSTGRLTTDKPKPCPIQGQANLFEADVQLDGELWPNAQDLLHASVSTDAFDAAACLTALYPRNTNARPLVSLAQGKVGFQQDIQIKKNKSSSAWTVTAQGSLQLDALTKLALTKPLAVTFSSSHMTIDGRWSIGQTNTAKPFTYSFEGDLDTQASEVVFRHPYATQGVLKQLKLTGLELGSQQTGFTLKGIRLTDPDFIAFLPKRDQTQDDQKTSTPQIQSTSSMAAGGLWDELFQLLNSASLQLINGRLQLADTAFPKAAPLLATKINASAAAGQIQLEASASLLDQAPLTADINLTGSPEGLSGKTHLSIQSLPLKPLSHYGESLTGLVIEDGTMSLQLPLTITHNKLVGQVAFDFQKLKLGARSALPNAPDKATSSKVSSAIDLLSDRKGNLSAQIDITGDLTNPQLSMRRLVTRAVGQLVQRMLTSPIDLIASMFGGEPGVDYSTIQFVPGTVRPFSNDGIKLKVLADTLKGRPDIVLKVIGSFEPRLDPGALKTQDMRDEFFDQTKDRMSRDFRLDTTPGFGAKGTDLQFEIELRQLARARAGWVEEQLVSTYGVNPEQLKSGIILSTTASADQQAMVRFELPSETELAAPKNGSEK